LEVIGQYKAIAAYGEAGVEQLKLVDRRADPLVAVSPEVVSALGTMPWPGNVRELENLVERLVVLVPRETVELADLRLHAPSANPETYPLTLAQEGLWPLRQLEGEYIAWVLARCGGNKTRAAELLGIDVSTIHRREREKGPGNSPR
jgi:two-component system, NtrC family, response regulator HydG